MENIDFDQFMEVTKDLTEMETVRSLVDIDCPAEVLQKYMDAHDLLYEDVEPIVSGHFLYDSLAPEPIPDGPGALPPLEPVGEPYADFSAPDYQTPYAVPNPSFAVPNPLGPVPGACTYVPFPDLPVWQPAPFVPGFTPFPNAYDFPADPCSLPLFPFNQVGFNGFNGVGGFGDMGYMGGMGGLDDLDMFNTLPDFPDPTTMATMMAPPDVEAIMANMPLPLANALQGGTPASSALSAAPSSGVPASPEIQEAAEEALKTFTPGKPYYGDGFVIDMFGKIQYGVSPFQCDLFSGTYTPPRPAPPRVPSEIEIETKMKPEKDAEYNAERDSLVDKYNDAINCNDLEKAAEYYSKAQDYEDRIRDLHGVPKYCSDPTTVKGIDY